MGLGKWLFSGRLRRLERAQEAAFLLGSGRIQEAEEKLEMARPRRYSEDLGVYHFVRARLLMAQGQWAEALVHLETAQALGLNRPTVELHLALVLARLARCLEAMEVLEGLGVDGNQEIQEQARALKEQLGEILSGARFDLIRRQAAEAAGRVFGSLPRPPLAPSRVRELVTKLEGQMPDDPEEVALALGWVLTQVEGSSWILGLEPLDHGVSIRGVVVWPGRIVRSVRQGVQDRLLFRELALVLEE